MTKRTNALSSKLGSEHPQGWRDQVGRNEQQDLPQKDTSKAGQYKRKTFLITPELENRIRMLADEQLVGQNELVRYLLTFALEQVENGVHKLPTRPVQQRTLGA